MFSAVGAALGSLLAVTARVHWRTTKDSNLYEYFK